MRNAVFLHNSGAPARTLGLCLPRYCCFVLSRSLSCGDGKLHPGGQTLFPTDRSPKTGEKTISMNLHFPSTSGEDFQLVLLPPLAGYTGLNGDSSLARATLVGHSSASTEVNTCPSPDHNCSCTRAHDH